MGGLRVLIFIHQYAYQCVLKPGAYVCKSLSAWLMRLVYPKGYSLPEVSVSIDIQEVL